MENWEDKYDYVGYFSEGLAMLSKTKKMKLLSDLRIPGKEGVNE